MSRETTALVEELHAIRWEHGNVGETECGLMYVPGAELPQGDEACCVMCACQVEVRGGFGR